MNSSRSLWSIFLALSGTVLVTLIAACGGGGSGIPSIDLSGSSRYLAISGDTVYVGDPLGDNIHVVDVSNPKSPRRIASFDARSPSIPFANLSGTLEASGTTLYVGNFDIVRILDVSNPAAPIERSTFPTTGGAVDADLKDGILYVASQGGGLRIVDVSDSTNQQLLSTIPSTSIIYKVVIQENIAYFMRDRDLVMADVSNPAQPEVLGAVTINNPGSVTDLDVAGGLAFVSAISGMQIVDVSNPADPRLRGSVPSQDQTIGVAAGRSGRVYMAELRAGMAVVDVSDPALPRVLETTAIGGEILSLLANGDSLYAAGGEAGFGIFDISTP